MKKRKAIFLDRDGVINAAVVRNGKPHPPASLAEVVIPQEVHPALAQLKAQGYLLIVVTNQPDVARGVTKREAVEEINQFLLKQLPLETVRVCYHDDRDACHCRKPSPGLLLEAAEQYGIDLGRSVMIGDRWKDVEAGKRAGCKTVFLDYGYLETNLSKADFTTTSLLQAARWINNILEDFT
jgi:D-glycero-D-manno-heptose 1,7-bisphosphate phosphatase